MDELSIKVNHGIKDIVVDMPIDIRDTITLLVLLTKTITEHYEMPEEELIGILTEMMLKDK